MRTSSYSKAIEMKNLFILLLTTVYFTATGQNLVPNPSFEAFGACPTTIEDIDKVVPWENPNLLSPDVFNSCICSAPVSCNPHGNQAPHSGDGYAGICMPAEYLQVQLLSPLVAGKKYEISYYISLADNFERAIDRVGVYFSDTKITAAFDQFLFAPQALSPTGKFLSDKINWVLIKDTIVAAGGESYMTIGNFFDKANTNYIKGLGGPMRLDSPPTGGVPAAYYFFDDFNLIEIECELPNVDLGNDTLICPGDEIVLDAQNTGASYLWSTGENSQNISVDTKGIYSVEVTDSKGCKGYDTVVIAYRPVPVADFSFYPNILSPSESTANFTNQSKDATQYHWKFGSIGTKGNPMTSNNENEKSWFNPAIAEQKAKLKTGMDSVPITLIVSNGYCVDSITKILLIRDVFTLFVPNAFSPNGDGVNDEFFPTGLNISCDNCTNYEFMVFDRWGEMIFYTHDSNAKWNGKRNNNLNDVQADIYVWKAIYTDADKGSKAEQMGIVTVVK